MRQYQPIWEALKNSPTCKVQVLCSPQAVRRLKKAVIKEKYADTDVRWRHRRLVVTLGALEEHPDLIAITFKLMLSLATFDKV